MNVKSLTALAVLNVVLLLAVSVTAFSPQPAQAQFNSASQYMIISGEVRGRTSQAGIYVIDRTSSQVMGIFFNSATDQMEVVAPPRSIRQDIQSLKQNR